MQTKDVKLDEQSAKALQQFVDHVGGIEAAKQAFEMLEELGIDVEKRKAA